MKILFVGKTMNYYIGDGINIRKSDNITGKVLIDIPDWKANQLLSDFPENFVKEQIVDQELDFVSEKEIVGSPDEFKPQIKKRNRRKKAGAK